MNPTNVHKKKQFLALTAFTREIGLLDSSPWYNLAELDSKLEQP